MAKTSALGLAMLCMVLAAVSPITVQSNSRKEIVLYTTFTTSGPLANTVVVAGRPGHPSPNGDRFGDVTVFDLPLTESPDANSPEVGKLQGILEISSMDGTRSYITETAIIERGKYKVGTLQHQGTVTKVGSAFNGEYAVTSGTGAYRFMGGYLEAQTIRQTQTPESIVVLLKYSLKEFDD